MKSFARFSFVFSLAALVLGIHSCTSPAAVEDAVLQRMQADVAYLASDSLEGRLTGSEGEKLAASYIASRLEDIGLKAAGENGTWFQDFTFTPHPPIAKHGEADSARLAMGPVKKITGRNVLAAIPGESDDWVVIGAHYDHLGLGDENSLAVGEVAVHNGADDNASGVAALLELARRFQHQKVKHNILLIGFSGEEKGLVGSKHFVANATIDTSAIAYMLNMDMVGRMNADSSLAVYGSGTAPEWDAAIAASNQDSLNLLFHESGVGPSDHTSFYLSNMPVLHFFTGQHEDYHKPTDDSDKLNYDGLVLVTDFIERIVRHLNEAPRVSFTKTKDQSNDSVSSFKVTLGVVPDYIYDGEGMRLDGVSEGRPAHTAGLIKGDIVKRLGEVEVVDIYAYMEALGTFEAGDSTEVVVERQGQLKTFSVIWD